MKKTVEIVGYQGRKATLTVEEISQNRSANTSTVRWTLTISEGTSARYNTNVSVKINGETAYSSVAPSAIPSFPAARGTRTGDITVTHNEDGTGMATFTLTAVFGDNLQSVALGIGSKTENGRIILDEFSDASTLTFSNAEQTIGQSFTVTSTKANPSYTDVIKLHSGNREATLTSGTAFTIPMQWCDTVTGGNVGEAFVSCETYNGSTLVDTRRKYLTLIVPASAGPTIDSVSFTEMALLPSAFGTKIVQALSRIKVTAIVTTQYGAEVKEISVNDEKTSGDEIILNPFRVSGTVPISVTVTDTRGMKDTYDTSITVTEYFVPTVSGKAGDATLTIHARGASVDGTNTMYATLRRRQVGEETWTTEINRQSVPMTWDYTVVYPSLEGNNEWELTLEDAATDAGLKTPVYWSDVSGEIAISLRKGGKGVAFFKEAARDGIDVNGTVYMNGNGFSHIEFGHAEMPFGPTGEHSVHVSFSRPFTQLPVVFTPAIFGTVNVLVSDDEISLTGFDALLGGPAGTAESTRGFSWIAIGD